MEIWNIPVWGKLFGICMAVYGYGTIWPLYIYCWFEVAWIEGNSMYLSGIISLNVVTRQVEGSYFELDILVLITNF